MSCGIYKLSSYKFPKRIYIGSSVNLIKRLSQHVNLLAKNTHPNPKLQHHFNKYGIDDLRWCIIELCTKEILIEREQYYIDTLKPYFNIRNRAESNLGLKLSPATIIKMKKSAKAVSFKRARNPRNNQFDKSE